MSCILFCGCLTNGRSVVRWLAPSIHPSIPPSLPSFSPSSLLPFLPQADPKYFLPLFCCSWWSQIIRSCRLHAIFLVCGINYELCIEALLFLDKPGNACRSNHHMGSLVITGRSCLKGTVGLYHASWQQLQSVSQWLPVVLHYLLSIFDRRAFSLVAASAFDWDLLSTVMCQYLWIKVNL